MAILSSLPHSFQNKGVFSSNGDTNISWYITGSVYKYLPLSVRTVDCKFPIFY